MLQWDGLFPLVLILSLQSPWSSITQGSLTLQVLTGYGPYHALLSVEKSESEALDSLINRVDEQIRVIKSLSPSSFTLDDLYDELAVMAIIGALPHSFDDVVRTISVLDKFDKQSVVQSLRNMDHTRANFVFYHLCLRCVFSCSQMVSKRVPIAGIILLLPFVSEPAKCRDSLLFSSGQRRGT